jgi:hypothetical protein
MFIRCQWRPAPSLTLPMRQSDVIDALCVPSVQRVIGSSWFGLAYSKASAMAQAVNLNELRLGKKWRKSPLSSTELMYRLNLWNGDDSQGAASVSVTLHVPSIEKDTLIIDLPTNDQMKSVGIIWDDVLEIGRDLSMLLGAFVIISSDEIELANETNSNPPNVLAFASFTGINQSSKEKYQPHLSSNTNQLLTEVIICNEWPDQS